MTMMMMSDLSQAEIDALLAGAGGDDDSSASDAGGSDAVSDDELSEIEKDALGEIGNISMGNAATTLSTLLGHKVSITTPTVSVATMNIIQQHYRISSSKSATPLALTAITFWRFRQQTPQLSPI